MRTRRAGSFTVRMKACMPNLSSSCGRSSPSSGLPLPTRMKRAGWLMEMPSRSTVFQPDAAESSSTSTRWSSRRLTSSTYRMPRLARASRPGSSARTPSASARSMSMVPHTRSSVAPSGRSTRGVGTVAVGLATPALHADRASGPISSGLVGWLLNGSPDTTSMRGRRSARARTAVVLPVPRSPITITPLIRGSTTFKMSASCWAAKWQREAVNGETGVNRW
mmetsp:Transcript_40113/g.119467  ORF Transcript_40113/g.119467 Transcript_40113/m.119467 type:complete len:222 (-) Transcript_40113:249-914(-)